MVAAIRQTIKVEQDGRIEIRSPELQSGATAEVIVLVESGQRRSPLDIFDELQQIMGLDHVSAQAWAIESRRERLNTTRNLGATAE